MYYCNMGPYFNIGGNTCSNIALHLLAAFSRDVVYIYKTDLIPFSNFNIAASSALMQ